MASIRRYEHKLATARKAEERVAELEALAARCVGERERRPTFAEIAAEVGEERQHI